MSDKNTKQRRNPDKPAIQARIRELEISQRTLATRLDLDPSSIGRRISGETRTEPIEADIFAELLRWPREKMYALLDMPSAPLSTQDFSSPTPTNALVNRHRDLPVYGQAVGGDAGNYVFNGSVVDRVERPAVLENVENGYAVYVTGTSMEPRYLAGETAFVHPGRPITGGCCVVVQVKPVKEGDPPTGMIKRFVEDKGKTVVFEQFNPPRKIEIPRNNLLSMHRIVLSGDS